MEDEGGCEVDVGFADGVGDGDEGVGRAVVDDGRGVLDGAGGGEDDAAIKKNELRARQKSSQQLTTSGVRWAR